jgi:tetratricopeptide (TPR) repeat protein
MASNQQTAMTPDSLYASAVILCNPAAVSRPRQWKHRAKSLLRDSTAAAPCLSKAHALLAYVYFLCDDYATAEVAARKALRLDSDNSVYLRLLLGVLLRQRKTTPAARWLRKLAELEGVDLSELKLQLREANLPTDTATLALNAFPNTIAWFESYLTDEAEEMQLRDEDKSSVDSRLRQEIDRFRLKKIDGRKVPSELRHLIPTALEWGIGDDAARGSFLEIAPMKRKRQFRRVLTVKVRRQINDWLDVFGNETPMPDEAACFMYLLLAYEEIVN